MPWLFTLARTTSHEKCLACNEKKCHLQFNWYRCILLRFDLSPSLFRLFFFLPLRDPPPHRRLQLVHLAASLSQAAVGSGQSLPVFKNVFKTKFVLNGGKYWWAPVLLAGGAEGKVGQEEAVVHGAGEKGWGRWREGARGMTGGGRSAAVRPSSFQFGRPANLIEEGRT